MLIFAMLLQSVSAIPPPPAVSLAAATPLWAGHPAPASERDLAITIVVAEEAEQALVRGGARDAVGRRMCAARSR